MKKVWGKDERIELYKVLPLRTPFTIVVDPSSICNFKCKYCIHSLSNNKLQSIGFKSKIMEYNLFAKIIDDIRIFNDKVKCLQFGKLGEPLINKDLPKMIDCAKRSEKFERIEIITNGVLLTPQIIDELISSGVDVIRISMQGITQKKYYELAGVNLNFELFRNNIEYLYKNKKQCLIHLKMIDIGLDNYDDEKKFYKIFEKSCDELSIQYTSPLFSKYVNYAKLARDNNLNLFGDKLLKVCICPRPFISLAISSGGIITPCCREAAKEITLGDVKTDSIFEVWNGEKLKKFRLNQLNNKRKTYEICKDCYFPDTTTYLEDNLDKYSHQLISQYKNN